MVFSNFELNSFRHNCVVLSVNGYVPEQIFFMLFWSSALGIIASAAASGQECVRNNLTCVPSLSGYVNAALVNGSSFNFSRPVDVGQTSLQGGASPLSFTINECAKVLEGRLLSFDSFKASSETIWDDVSAVQTAMVGVQEAAQSVLASESEFAAQLDETNDLFKGTTDRVAALSEWLDGEKVVRNQLTDVFTTLDKNVIKTSKEVLLTTSALRDALHKMQIVNDHATMILTGVGDAETVMYEWAFNVSEAVNQHTVNLVTVAQTLQYRSTQVKNVKEANIQLNWIASKLAEKYGADKLLELGKLYDAGDLSTPAGTAQGPTSGSTTGGTSVPTVTS